ncbi:MAG: polyphosphate polymerase domain-containing protein [Lachnospiraceae bacterium]|nr:polyphosphate polymerase domain-containing protein [Lachnospiraceae bacterium]
MADKKQYRHEWKHAISYSDMLQIRSRMKAIAKSDPHTVDGKYLIRSLYFDTMNDKALKEKLDGVDKREKFRIRYYNFNPEVIHLEKKSKLNKLGTKYHAALTADQVEKIIKGDTDWMMDSDNPLIQELYLKMKYQGMRPKTIVDYTREPFIYAPGNVRVTLDYDLRTCLTVKDFLDPKSITLPVAEGTIILEVKWDDFLPSIIRDGVQLTNRRAQSFSKYAQCRIYD